MSYFEKIVLTLLVKIYNTVRDTHTDSSLFLDGNGTVYKDSTKERL